MPSRIALFYFGKIVVTGGKSVKNIIKGWETLWPQVQQYITT
jgi:TATA-box binding protein (TBP) (component of TFIID and TFIIIB)